MTAPTILELFPAFTVELEGLVGAAGRPELVGQIRDLRIVDRCRCGGESCGHFFTTPKPSGAYGPGHENVVLPAMRGMVILDLVSGRIVAVEVLDRPDVKAVLDVHLKPLDSNPMERTPPPLPSGIDAKDGLS